MSKTFCPLPWIHQAVRNNGDMRVCCQANVTPNQGTARKDDGTPFNAGKDSIVDAKNAIMIKEIRKNIINGVWSDECKRCQQEEESGMSSRRLNEIDQWNFTYEDAVNSTNDDGSINLDTRYYDLRFGNTCNLACRMCGPTDSHSWYEDWVAYDQKQGFLDSHGWVYLIRNEKGRFVTDDYNWHESEFFWQQIEEQINNIEHVYMAGGEPLIIDRHTLFLEKCIAAGRASKIILEYNTNITSLPKKVLELWTQFKQVRIGASVDGMGSMQEYQRYPIKWNTTLKNLIQLDEICQQNPNIMVHITYTVSAYNAFHLPEFMWWKLVDSGFKKINSREKRPVITTHPVHKPYCVSVRMYPESIRNKLKLHYDSWINKFLESDLNDNVKSASVSILKSILNFMDQEDLSQERIPEFVRFTKVIDQRRNQNILDVTPELGELFE